MKIQKFQNAAGSIPSKFTYDPESLLTTFPVTQKSSNGNIKEGKKTIGSVGSTNRVGQSSVFGERKPQGTDASLATRAVNAITDFLHLTSPPTYTDGYGTTRNADVPLGQSARGQELKRQGETAKDAAKLAAEAAFTYAGTRALLPAWALEKGGIWKGIKAIPKLADPKFRKGIQISHWLPSGLLYNPGEWAGTLVGSAALGGAGKGIGWGVDKLAEKQGYEFRNPAKDVLSTVGGLIGGVGGWQYGNAVTKRAIEAVMHGSGGAADPLGGIEDFRHNTPRPLQKDVAKYVLFGKQNPTKTANTIRFTPNTSEGVFAKDINGTQYNARYYDGLHGVSFTEGKPSEGADLVRAGLYREPLTVFKEIPTTLFKDYTNLRYPKVADKIKTYTTTKDSGLTPTKNSIQINSVAQNDVNFPEEGLRVDAGGHWKQRGYDSKGLPLVREYDIWKYQPEEYMDRYFKENEGKNPNWKVNWGLHVVDNHFTPVITDTGWEKDPYGVLLSPSSATSTPQVSANNITTKKFFVTKDGKTQLIPNTINANYEEAFNTAMDLKQFMKLKSDIVNDPTLSDAEKKTLFHAINTKKKYIQNGWWK